MDHNFRPLKPFFKRKNALESPHSQLSNAFFLLKNHLMDQKLWTIIVECISTSIKYHINTTLIFCRSHFLQIPLFFVWRRDCFCKSHFFVPVLRRYFCLEVCPRKHFFVVPEKKKLTVPIAYGRILRDVRRWIGLVESFQTVQRSSKTVSCT